MRVQRYHFFNEKVDLNKIYCNSIYQTFQKNVEYLGK